MFGIACCSMTHALGKAPTLIRRQRGSVMVCCDRECFTLNFSEFGWLHTLLVTGIDFTGVHGSSDKLRSFIMLRHGNDLHSCKATWDRGMGIGVDAGEAPMALAAAGGIAGRGAQGAFPS